MNTNGGGGGGKWMQTFKHVQFLAIPVAFEQGDTEHLPEP